jgi:hypothetical protein
MIHHHQNSQKFNYMTICDDVTPRNVIDMCQLLEELCASIFTVAALKLWYISARIHSVTSIREYYL